MRLALLLLCIAVALVRASARPRCMLPLDGGPSMLEYPRGSGNVVASGRSALGLPYLLRLPKLDVRSCSLE